MTEPMNEQHFDPNEADSGSAEVGDTTGEAETDVIAQPERRSVSQSTMVLFGIMLIGAAGMYFMYLRAGPDKAGAASPEQAAADQTISTFLSDNGANIRQM